MAGFTISVFHKKGLGVMDKRTEVSIFVDVPDQPKFFGTMTITHDGSPPNLSKLPGFVDCLERMLSIVASRDSEAVMWVVFKPLGEGEE